MKFRVNAIALDHKNALDRTPVYDTISKAERSNGVHFLVGVYAGDCICRGRRGGVGRMTLDEILEATEAELLIPPLLRIVVGSPPLDIVYQHQVEAEMSFLGTRKMREILGDEAPLPDPEVRAFVRGALTEGLATLGSEVII